MDTSIYQFSLMCIWWQSVGMCTEPDPEPSCSLTFSRWVFDSVTLPVMTGIPFPLSAVHESFRPNTFSSCAVSRCLNQQIVLLWPRFTFLSFTSSVFSIWISESFCLFESINLSVRTKILSSLIHKTGVWFSESFNLLSQRLISLDQDSFLGPSACQFLNQIIFLLCPRLQDRLSLTHGFSEWITESFHHGQDLLFSPSSGQYLNLSDMTESHFSLIHQVSVWMSESFGYYWDLFLSDSFGQCVNHLFDRDSILCCSTLQWMTQWICPSWLRFTCSYPPMCCLSQWNFQSWLRYTPLSFSGSVEIEFNESFSPCLL